MGVFWNWKHRPTEEANKALSAFCNGVGTHGDRNRHIFSIPVDFERDADCILSDVIAERDALRKVVDMVQRLSIGVLDPVLCVLLDDLARQEKIAGTRIPTHEPLLKEPI